MLPFPASHTCSDLAAAARCFEELQDEALARARAVDAAQREATAAQAGARIPLEAAQQLAALGVQMQAVQQELVKELVQRRDSRLQEAQAVQELQLQLEAAAQQHQEQQQAARLQASAAQEEAQRSTARAAYAEAAQQAAEEAARAATAQLAWAQEKEQVCAGAWTCAHA